MTRLEPQRLVLDQIGQVNEDIFISYHAYLWKAEREDRDLPFVSFASEVQKHMARRQDSCKMSRSLVPR
jgi:hypothetical protein